jgi:SAM-dependent methyltransferase
MALEWSTVGVLDGKGMFRAGMSVLDIGSSNVYSADASGIEAFVARYNSAPPAALASLATDIAQRSQVLLDGQQQNLAFFGEVLTAAGLGYESIDIAEGYRTTVLDLNHDPLPTPFAGAFDLVLNVGTSEHVLDQVAVLRCVHDATKPGGLMFHQLPASGFANHGYFCYTPRLFCDLAGYNRYEIVDLWFDGPSARHNLLGAVAAYRHVHPALHAALERLSQSERGRIVEETLVPDMAINVLMRRTSSARFLGALETSTSVGRIAPKAWDAYSSSFAQRAMLRTRAAATRRFPDLVRLARRLRSGNA